MVGFEGAVGITVFLGSETAAYDAIAHIGGRALAIKADVAKAMFQEDQEFQSAVLSHVRAMLRQISQIAVCNSLHSTEQRLCRWLLMTLERAPTSSFNLTQGTIAQLLSVRRESITSALGKLQNDGIIQTGRGHIEIVDVSGLMAASCECYDAIRAEYDWSGSANMADEQRTFPSSACFSQKNL